MKLEFLVQRGVFLLAGMLFALGLSHPVLAADDEHEKSGESEDGAKKESAEESDEASKNDEDRKGDTSETDEDDGKPEKAKDEAFGHGGQFGARVGVVGGYRMILRYDDSQLCRKFDPAKGQNQPKFCGHVAPFALTSGLSYGIADWLEPFAWGRFGLEEERETYTEPVIMFGAGVRVYTMSDAPFKIFIEPAVGIEIEDGIYGTYDNDFVLHLAAGPTLDFARYFGAYVTGGITTTIVRALSSSLDVELGIQGRYP